MALRYIAADQVIAAAGAALACPHEAEPEVRVKRPGFFRTWLSYFRGKISF